MGEIPKPPQAPLPGESPDPTPDETPEEVSPEAAPSTRASAPIPPGTVHPGRPPRLQKIGRTAAVVGVAGFLLLLAYLTVRYPHGGAGSAGKQAQARPPSLEVPLTAQRIEEYAKKKLRDELRARLRANRPAPGPPDLSLPGEAAGGAPTTVRFGRPETSPPKPAGPRLPALRSPLSPAGAQVGAGASLRPTPSASAPEAPLPPSAGFWASLRDGLSGAGRPRGASGVASEAGGYGAGEASPGAAPPAPEPLEARRVDLPSSEVHRLRRLEPAAGRRTLSTGTVVPLVLTHDLSTDVPGPVRAWVSRDVYDSLTHSVLLIPRGSLALGDQSARTAAGDRRVLIAWRQLRLPSGAVYALPELPAGSADGTAGARGQVDRHWWSRFGSAVALSLVGAAGQLSQPQARTAVAGFAADPGQVVAQQLGLELATLSREVLQRGLSRAPTIHLSAGRRLTLLVTRDLAF